MQSKPDLYARKFIFRPLDEGAARDIRAATVDAYNIILRQTQKFIAAPNVSGSPNTTTGHYVSSIRISLDNQLIKNVSDLDTLNGNSVVSITNVAEYATRTESNAFYFAAVGGIFYYAAKEVGKKYPQLSFRFSFVRQGNKIFGQSRAPGSSFPVLLIGTRQSVIYKLEKPRRETYNPKTGRRRSGYKARYAPNATGANPVKA